jgi:GMC oxidoreductase
LTGPNFGCCVVATSTAPVYVSLRGQIANHGAHKRISLDGRTMPRSFAPSQDDNFARRARVDRDRLGWVLKSGYDLIVSGPVRWSQEGWPRTPDVSALQLEAGGDESVPNVRDSAQWPTSIGSESDWGFRGVPNPRLNGHSIDFAMGKVLGGGSSINLVVWASSQKCDWEFFATEPAANGLRSFRRRDRPLPGLVALMPCSTLWHPGRPSAVLSPN